MQLQINTEELQEQVLSELTGLMTCCNDDVFKFCRQYDWDIYDFIDNAYE